MAAFSIAALKAELDNDPASVGYATPLSKGDAGVLQALVNAVNAGITVTRNDIAAKEVANAIAVADFAALTALQFAQLQFLFIGGIVDVTFANVKASFTAIFSGATAATKNALVALSSRNGSRAEQLWGTGFVVSQDQIVAAMH